MPRDYDKDNKLMKGSGVQRVKRTFEDVEDYITEEDENISVSAGVPERKADSELNQSMDELRSIARQRYLSKRQREKLQWLVKDLQIWEEDVRRYGWNNLTTTEQNEIILKRQLFQLLKETDSEDNPNKFHFQDEKPKKELLSAKTNNRDDKVKWEEEQLKKSVRKADVDEIKVSGSDKYDFVFDPDAMITFTEDDEDRLNQDQDSKLSEASFGQ